MISTLGITAGFVLVIGGIYLFTRPKKEEETYTKFEPTVEVPEDKGLGTFDSKLYVVEQPKPIKMTTTTMSRKELAEEDEESDEIVRTGIDAYNDQYNPTSPLNIMSTIALEQILNNDSNSYTPVPVDTTPSYEPAPSHHHVTTSYDSTPAPSYDPAPSSSYDSTPSSSYDSSSSSSYDSGSSSSYDSGSSSSFDSGSSSSSFDGS